MADTPAPRNWKETLVGVALIAVALGVLSYLAHFRNKRRGGAFLLGWFDLREDR
jgi:hypothetical protein